MPFFFSFFSRRLGVTFGCRCFGEVFICHRLGAVFVCYRLCTTFVCRHRGAEFIYVMTIQTSKVYPISNKEIKSMVVLQNYNHMYSSHNGNVKCVCSTIKYIDFESIHHAIN